MIIHSLKIIINQWRKNVWLVLELFLVFSIVWYVFDHFSVLYLTSRIPTGFEIDNTYMVKLSVNRPESPSFIDYGEGSEEPARNFFRIVDIIKQRPDVKAVSIGQWHYPYSNGGRTDVYKLDSIEAFTFILTATPEYFDVFRVKAAYGETTEQLKAALENGEILSKTIEEKLFQGKKGVGREVYSSDTTNAITVSAVVNTMKRTPFQRPSSCVLKMLKVNELYGKSDREIWDNISICILAKPTGNENDFANTFAKDIRKDLNVGNFFLSEIVPISRLRDYIFKTRGVYEAIQYRVAFGLFFMVNVFLGVIGAFWLRVKKRIPEIGLRMAVGSSRGKLVWQMMAESLVIALIALIPAVVVWVNLVYLDILPAESMDVTSGRMLLNSALTVGTVAVIIVVATLYPALRSSRIQPAEALHYE